MGAAGEVYAADWGGIHVAVKVAAESWDVSFDEAHRLLQHEEEVYRHLYSRMKGSAGVAGIVVCCDTPAVSCHPGSSFRQQALPRSHLRSNAGNLSSGSHWVSEVTVNELSAV